MKWILKTTLFKAFLSEFRWYRKYHGGKWEKWYLDPCDGWVWIDVRDWFKDTNLRPQACWLGPDFEEEGAPETEDYL